MSVFINNIPIAPRIIKKIDNNALSASYQFSLDADVPVHIKFVEMKGVTSYELVQEYIYMRAVANNSQICAHIWFHHPEYINSVNFRNVCKFLQNENYDMTLIDDELIRPRMNELPIPQLMSDNTIKCEVPMLIEYFYKMEVIDSPKCYVPIEHKYINGSMVYTKNIYNIDPNVEYTYTHSYDNLIETLKHGKMRNIIIDFNASEYKQLVDYKLDKYPTTEDLKTWRISGNCRDLRCLFMEYPYEIDLSNWQMSHLRIISCLFTDTKLHPAVSDMKFLSCIRASLCFASSNIKVAPVFERLFHIDNMFYNCKELVDISNIKSNTGITFITDFCTNCPKLKNGLSGCTIENGAIYMRGCTSLQEYLYKDCVFTYDDMGFSIAKLKKEYHHLPNLFMNCTFTSDDIEQR